MSPSKATRRRLRVLVLDDRRERTCALAGRVRGWGHVAIEADDGQSALRTAAARRPDVVLLAIDLPHLDGGSVARQLRLDFTCDECFIVGMIARVDERLRSMCIRAGIDFVLARPINLDVVETLLELELGRINRGRGIHERRAATVDDDTTRVVATS
ncbi:MAG: response regulator [Pirellulales bacterium]|nr:response regulator [Pirellulales bacterium]